MAKALGAEIMEFYDHHWPEGYYHDDNGARIGYGEIIAAKETK
jgi:hypothetical protein